MNTQIVKLPPDSELIINQRVEKYVSGLYKIAGGLQGRNLDYQTCLRLQAIVNWAFETFRSEKTGDSYIQGKTSFSYLYGMSDAQIEAELASQIEMRKRTAGRRAAVKKYGAAFVSKKIGRQVNQS
jgi:hypothetical protein